MNLTQRSLVTLSLLIITACSTKEVKKNFDQNITTPPVSPVHLEVQPITETTPTIATPIQQIPIPSQPVEVVEVATGGGVEGEFAGNYKLMDFIDYMHNYHEFSHKELYTLFSQARDINQMVQPYRANNSTSSVRKGKWDRYKDMFVYERNINRGVNFWAENESTLNRAYQKYGVPPEYVVGIIGIETAYGVNFGKKKVIDVLTSKAMLGDRRENFYTKQLEKFLIMTRQAGLTASELMGSNAGAMGYGQFIASSYLNFAVDFNNDGVTDLWNAQDAIGSVANYFAQNGWNRSISQVAVRAKYNGNRFKRLKTGYKTKYSQSKLRRKYKITPRHKLRYRGPVSLIKLPRASYDELWFGTHNFRVITTYNHSTFYGMAVYQLGEAVKRRKRGY